MTSAVNLSNVASSLFVSSNTITTGTYNSSSVFGYKNKIINGNFDIWQRGTSYSGIGSGVATNAFYYQADKWLCQAFPGSTGSGTTNISITQQSFTLGQTTVPNEPKYFLRSNASVIGTLGGTASVIRIAQRIESVRTFAGQTVTVSFYAKADTSRTYALVLEQYFGTGGSPSTQVAAGQTTFSITSSFQYFSFTFNIPSISGKTLGTSGDDYFGVNFILYKGDNNLLNDTLGAIGTWSITPYLDLSQVQIETGSVATPFDFRPIGTEQMLCQRYFQFGPQDCVGVAFNTTNMVINIPFAVPMRTTPVSLTLISQPYSESPWFSAVASNTGVSIVNTHLGPRGGAAQLTGYTGLTAGSTAMVRGEHFAFNADYA